jgi:L-ascorbate metabolism protein UlaG (beta-lactamase superfamily)
MTSALDSDTTPTTRFGINFLHVGGPTALLSVAGLRILTDPTFSPPGQFPVGPRALTKLTGPAVTADSIGPIDLVLLSHDQHPDNLDTAGRELLNTVPVVLSTAAAASNIPGVHPVEPWESVDVPTSDGALTVTAVPAVHGTAELGGPVIGFVLAGTNIPSIYVSGDNSSVEVVADVVTRLGPIDVAVLFTGAARRPDSATPLTLTADDAVAAAKVLGDAVIVPIHSEGWLHFTEGPGTVHRAFADAGLVDRLVFPLAGTTTIL